MPRPDRSRVALVDTAALLFRRQGYAATGVNQILEIAGVKAGSLYHHFPSGKQELAAAVVDGVGSAIERRLRELLDSGSPVSDIVDGWIDLMAAGLAGDRRDGCPIEPIATESVNASEQVREASARAFGGLVPGRRGPAARRRLAGCGCRPDRAGGHRAHRGRVDPVAHRGRCGCAERRQGGRAHADQSGRRRTRRRLTPAANLLARQYGNLLTRQ